MAEEEVEEGLGAGSLSWQGAEGAGGRFQVCVCLGTVPVSIIGCSAVQRTRLCYSRCCPSFDRDKKRPFGPLRDATYRGEGVAGQSGICFSAIVELQLLTEMLYGLQIF